MDFTTTTLLTLSLLVSLSAASTLLDAADILSAAGFGSMALHLELAAKTLQPPDSVTIFSPSNAAFRHHHNNIPLSLLRFHLLPNSFSLNSLTSLPSGAAIPTLLPHHSLTVTSTTPHQHLSLNNVTVNPDPLFYDTHLSIFAIHTTFNLHFLQTPPIAATCPNKILFSLHDASHALRSRGFSFMASVLDIQFPTDANARRELTLFALPDEAIAKHAGNVTEFPALLRRHLVPCKIVWHDLANLEDGTLIGTFEKGFSVNVTKSKTHRLLLNGVVVTFPEMYRGDWFVVHGVKYVLFGHKGKKHHHHHHHQERGSGQIYVAERDGEQGLFSEFGERQGEGNSAQHYHFSVFH